MQAVLLDAQTFSHQITFDAIEQAVDCLTSYATTAQEQVVSRSIDADVILTNKVVLNRKVLQQLPKLKLICITATGINNVDIQAARELNIAVTNVSGYAKNSVAQYVFAQLLAYYSEIAHHNSNCQQGLWQQSETFCLHGNGSVELAGKSIAIIGYGALGQKVAQIAKVFEMDILIAERPTASTIRSGRMAFTEAVQQADIISLHCPQTPETENMMNADVFHQMKNDTVLINTARGALINNEDLLSALNNGQLACAILDVLEQEPPPSDHMLIAAQSEKLKITAHIAWASTQAQQALLNLVAKNIAAFQYGKDLNRVD